MHLIISEDTLSLCILPEYQDYFLQNYDTYFGENQFAGVLILELESNTGLYLSEKCYTIGTNKKLKSVPPICHNLAQINHRFFYTAIKIHPVLGMTTQIQNKQLGLLLIPRKRYFVNHGKLSYPLHV